MKHPTRHLRASSRHPKRKRADAGRVLVRSVVAAAVLGSHVGVLESSLEVLAALANTDSQRREVDHAQRLLRTLRHALADHFERLAGLSEPPHGGNGDAPTNGSGNGAGN